jgi:hypothetical protein
MHPVPSRDLVASSIIRHRELPDTRVQVVIEKQACCNILLSRLSRRLGDGATPIRALRIRTQS